MAEFTSNEHCSPSGHGEDFVEEVEEGFQCPICHSPLKEPVFTRCGHRYCKECLDEHIGRQQSKEESLTCTADRFDSHSKMADKRKVASAEKRL
ncbi:hypothetical protein pdam_00023213 [Pocillopora damicornis]|uniref:RING-type domain-containing protein n=1 Tax=Pocillopora damicornis TaxID=46731 RepID=A0A3M6UN59_POCDA|nr:hypothetical protein pdam_00023213 [Pocillopora damicornis]